MYLPVYADSSLTDLDPQLVTFPGVSLLETGTKDFSSNAHSYTLSLPDGTSKTYTVEAALANNPVLDGFYADPEIIYSEKDQKFYY